MGLPRGTENEINEVAKILSLDLKKSQVLPEPAQRQDPSQGMPQAGSQIFTFTDEAGGSPPKSEPVGGRQMEL